MIGLVGAGGERRQIGPQTRQFLAQG